MWRCPECHEQLEDQFESCWKCAGNGDMDTVYRISNPAGRKRQRILFLAIAIAVFPVFAAPHILNFFTHTVYKSANAGGTAYFVRQSDAFTTAVDLYVRDSGCSFCTMHKVAAVLDSPIGPYPQQAIWSVDGSVVAVRADNGMWKNAYDYRLHRSYGQEHDVSSAITALLGSRGGEGKIIFSDPNNYKSLSRPLYPWELLALE